MGVQKNQFGLDAGFSTQVIQLYLRDPNAPNDAPTSAESRMGAVSTFQEAYHYRVHVQASQTLIEHAGQNPEGEDYEPVVSGFPASGDTENNTITFSVPKEPFDTTNFTEMSGAVMVFSNDGFGIGGIRQDFGAEAGDWSFGGAKEDALESAPRVLDLVGPETIVNQSKALAYSTDSPPSIPLYSMADLVAGDTINDPEGDDYGPGTYTYPTNLEPGQCDVQQLDIETTDTHWEFTAHMSVQKNQFENEAGFSTQVIQLYIRDPNAPDDAPTSTESRVGAVSTFQEAYHYRVHVDAGNTLVEHANQDPSANDYEPLVSGFSASGDTENNTISFSLPKDVFDSDRLGDLKITMLVFSDDGFGRGGIRQIDAGEADDWIFGGAKEGAIESAPRALDLVGPDNVVEQEESLSYSEGSPPSIPLFNVTSLVTGEAAVGISAVAAPIGEVWATLDGTLNGTNSEADGDVDLSYQWEQTGGPEAEIADTSAVETTFTAPEVEEETTLEFTLTVSDPDGNEATDTTTATIKPQSANDAPIADAGEDQTVSPGDAVSLQTVNSEDPNGGTLSFQWEQTGGTPEVDLIGADSSGAAFTAPDVDEETTLTFELAVSDGQGKTTTDTVSVTISPSDGGGTETETRGSDTTTEPMEPGATGSGAQTEADGAAGGDSDLPLLPVAGAGAVAGATGIAALRYRGDDESSTAGGGDIGGQSDSPPPKDTKNIDTSTSDSDRPELPGNSASTVQIEEQLMNIDDHLDMARGAWDDGEYDRALSAVDRAIELADDVAPKAVSSGDRERLDSKTEKASNLKEIIEEERTAAENVRVDLNGIEATLNDIEDSPDIDPDSALEELTAAEDTLKKVMPTIDKYSFADAGERSKTLENRIESLREDAQSAKVGVAETIRSPDRHSLSYDALNKGDHLGSGGNADVYYATAETDDGQVKLAIKEPRMSGTLHTETVDRMLEEAETWQRLDDHNHIVSVVDYGAEPLPWIAMEYMDHGHLGERGPEMDFKQALWTAIATTKAVRHAHRRGIAHLDIKPENVLLRTTGDDTWAVPKVADWGLSKQLLEHSKSVEGMSPHYAAPEQFDEDFGPTDDVTDVYQLGAVFYELFTGRPPFEGRPTKVMRAVMDDEPPAPSEVADVPGALDDILLQTLAKDKGDRYESVLYLRDDLQELFDNLA